jgi:MFS transporter, DHA1 family, multidrug resistance protein
MQPTENAAQLKRLVPVLIIISMIGPLALNILMPSMPGLAQVFNASRAEIQMTLSLFLAAQAVSQLFIGGLADRFGRKPVLIWALALYVLASIAASFATSILLLIIARVVQAAGSTAGMTISRTVVRDLAPRETAASMIGYVTMGMVVAPLVAPGLGGFVDDTYGWRMIFWICAILGIATLVLAIMQLPETRPASIVGQSAGDVLRRSVEVTRNRRFLAYAGGAALTSGVFFAFLGAAPYLVVEVMQISKLSYGIWFICLSGGYMIGNFCSGRFSERLGVDRMILYGNVVGLVGAAAFLLMAFVPIMHPMALFLPCLITSFGNGLLLPNAIAAAVSVDPKAAGAASGVTGFLQMGIGAVVSYITGQMTGVSPLPVALVMFGLTVASWWVLGWGKRRG